jgi:hypothetical protein
MVDCVSADADVVAVIADGAMADPASEPPHAAATSANTISSLPMLV